MYLTAETQARIAERLHYSLEPDGLLFLGKAEMLLSQSSLFSPVDLKNRFFRRVGGTRTRPRITATVPPAVYPPTGDDAVTLRAEALAASPVAQIVLNQTGEVVLSNHRADTLFNLSASDAGRPFQDLEVSYRPVELRSAVEQAHTQRRTVWIRDVEFTRPRTDRTFFDVQVVPLRTPLGHVLGTAVVFIDVSRSRQLQDELEDAHRQLETAYEELQSTNEELETTNEELQSTVEELETTNEELHSTNEELETMNEELQSMNDELQNSNHELRLRTDEVSALNGYMEGVFASLRVGVAVVDADMRITVWNAWAADLWGVRADEAAGEHLLNLDIGLPLHEIGPAVRTVLAGEHLATDDAVLELAAVNRRGRPVRVQVTVSSLAGPTAAPGPSSSWISSTTPPELTPGPPRLHPLVGVRQDGAQVVAGGVGDRERGEVAQLDVAVLAQAGEHLEGLLDAAPQPPGDEALGLLDRRAGPHRQGEVLRGGAQLGDAVEVVQQGRGRLGEDQRTVDLHLAREGTGFGAVDGQDAANVRRRGQVA